MSSSYISLPVEGGGGGGAVDSVFGRTGTVTSQSGDYTASQITNVPAGGISSVNVQNAINELDAEKQTLITGAATTIISSNLTASKALISDGSGKVAVSTTTGAELAFVNGVTSAIQTQLNNKQPLISLAIGSIPFSDGATLIDDNAHLFWDNTNKSLEVTGNILSTASATDSGASAAIFNASSNTTINGSNTTLGINGVASATVQTGADNDKSLGGMNFSITRGDSTDDGILEGMTGANTLLFINSGAAGVTQKVYGMSTLLFSQQGTVDNLYDFYSARIPAGTGVVTNHYGVFIEKDSTTPVKNYLSGTTKLGGNSVTDVNNGLTWNDTDTKLEIGDQPALTGDVDGIVRTFKTITDFNSAAVYGTYVGGLSAIFTDNSTTAIIATALYPKVSVASGKSIGGLIGSYIPMGRAEAGDDGSVPLAAGYLTNLSSGNSATKNTGLYAAFMTAFGQVDSNAGQISNMYDFYAQAQSLASGSVSTRYGIVIEPDANYIKQNWLSGQTQLGDTSFSAPTKTLEVHGDMSATGDIAAATITPANGASGTFTTTDLKTVTVVNGIITSIV